MKTKWTLSGIVLFLAAVMVFVTSPNLNPLYSEGAFFWLVLISIFAGIIFLLPSNINRQTMVDGTFLQSGMKKTKTIKIVIGVVAGLWVLYFLASVLFSPLFFYKSYRDQMAQPVEVEFTSEVQALDISQIPVVDAALARTLADKKLGESPSLGSQVSLGEPTIQTVNGKLIWAVPLHHSGFFKWLSNMDGAAGYIKVSATDLKDVEYVSDYKIKIQPNCYLMDDLDRWARFSGGFFTGITDYSFELDDSGKPYWAVTTYHNTCGFGLPEADGILLVDAQSGHSQRYGLADVPEWIDRVQPEDFIMNQFNNKGEYVHGVFNFSNKEKYRASAGQTVVYNNGRCYLFTGITSVGIDESATGFLMVNMVTKEPILYRMAGATESSAQQSAQGKVQDLGYYATAPIILNLYNEPTYFMTLKDNAGLIKKYAFVSVKDYMVVGIGDSITAAKDDYVKAMGDISNRPIFSGDQVVQELTGTIGRISWTMTDEETRYYFTLTEQPQKRFSAAVSVSTDLVLTQPGDRVQLSIQVTEEGAQNVTVFENKSVDQVPVANKTVD